MSHRITVSLIALVFTIGAVIRSTRREVDVNPHDVRWMSILPSCVHSSCRRYLRHIYCCIHWFQSFL